MPGGPELARHVWKCIETVSVEPGRFRPPDTVLEKILRHDRIFGVEVGQYIDEPTLGKIFRKTRRRVWVHERFKGVVRGRLIVFSVENPVKWRGGIYMLRGCSVKPIGQGRIFYPGVIWADMVDDRVEQNFHL